MKSCGAAVGGSEYTVDEANKTVTLQHRVRVIPEVGRAGEIAHIDQSPPTSSVNTNTRGRPEGAGSARNLYRREEVGVGGWTEPRESLTRRV